MEAHGDTAAQRNGECRHIGEKREAFAATGDPVISVDTKKLNDNFSNSGRKWYKAAEPMLAHDWPQDTIDQAVPYGVDEVTAHVG